MHVLEKGGVLDVLLGSCGGLFFKPTFWFVGYKDTNFPPDFSFIWNSDLLVINYFLICMASKPAVSKPYISHPNAAIPFHFNQKNIRDVGILARETVPAKWTEINPDP